MRLIDAEAFDADIIKRYCKHCDNGKGLRCRVCWINDMLCELEDAPTIEAKPVVYCKDCEYFNPHCQSCFLHWQEDDDPNVFCFQTNPDDYCSFAEKKKPISQTHENGVKIPVISMEDLPKIAKEMEK